MKTNEQLRGWLDGVVDDAVQQHERDVEDRAWMVVVEWAKRDAAFIDEPDTQVGLAEEVICRAKELARICDVAVGPCIVSTGEEED